MQKPLFIKISVIGILCLIFAIGLAMIQSLVSERQDYASHVNSELAQQHVSSQTVMTPFIIMSPTIKTCKKPTNKQGGALAASTSCKVTKQKLNIILPNQTETLEVFDVSDDTYQRGIYHATSFEGTLDFKQQYTFEQENEQTKQSSQTKQPQSDIASNTPKKESKEFTSNAELLIPISDLRGVTKMPTVKVNGTTLTAHYPTTPILRDLDYLTVSLPENLAKLDNLDIQINIPLIGMDKVQTIPLGTQFMLSMQSNWHAPNFVGQGLPNHKAFGDADNQGFTASWQNQHLTITNNQSFVNCVNKKQGNCNIGNDLHSFDVEFAEPNDVYLQTERSLKYGLLLIAVSFGSFFLFEIIKSLRIHPIQYLLVGMALLMFYVLLLSLSEQIAFWQAYAIAGTACAGLIGWYAYFVLHSVMRAGIFTLILGGQYAGFFTILTMEELNLLIGAILCFVLIASVMFLTRHIDWYEVAQYEEDEYEEN